VVWTYRDVRLRTTDPLSQSVAVLLVGLFNLPGLIVYLVIRPQETLADAYERSLEAEAILQDLQLDSSACQTCRRPVEPDFNVCPYCKTLLREPCKNCGKAVRTNWLACPYCATDRVVPRPSPAPRSAGTPTAAAPMDTMQAPRRPARAQADAQAQAAARVQRPPSVRPSAGP
jgi:RNA polymerase subunit RPABC4/transcription elongation factor Spt4